MRTFRLIAAARSVVAFIPPGWWKRRPFLPLPDRALVEFRMETAYGSKIARPSWGDIGHFLNWTIEMRRLRREIPRSTGHRR